MYIKFNSILKKKMSGVVLPAAVVLTFAALTLTLGYMDRILSKKNAIDYRIAKVKARFNAESGIAITIAGSIENEQFMPSIASSKWPVGYEDEDIYQSEVIDSTTFSGSYKPEEVTSFFPNAGISNTPDIGMGEFYDVLMITTENEITRRPERIATASGKAVVENFWKDDVELTDDAVARYTVEVLSDYMYLTHHEFAGGSPAIFGPRDGSSADWRRQPCFGPDDDLGTTGESLVGFVQTLDPMQFCQGGLPQFQNLVYVTEATNNNETTPEEWASYENEYGQSFNTQNVSVGDPVMPDFTVCNCESQLNTIFTSSDGLGDGDLCEANCGWEMRDPVCFPLEGYKETVQAAHDTYDSTEMLYLSNQSNINAVLKDTLIMTELFFMQTGGYRVKRWWYLMPPYLRSNILDPDGNGVNDPDSNVDDNLDGLNDYTHSMPHHLEGMPSVTHVGENATPTTAELEALNDLYCDEDDTALGFGYETVLNAGGAANDLCDFILPGDADDADSDGAITTNLIGDISRSIPYQEALHDFSALKVSSHATPLIGGLYLTNTYDENYNTDYNVEANHNGGPGGGITRLSHYDIENFTDYFDDKNFGDGEASSHWLMNTTYANGGNLIEDSFHPYGQEDKVIIHVKGGPVRVHGTFYGAYTVVTSGFDATGDNNCLEAGCAGYDGYSTYRRHAWMNSTGSFGGPPPDTLRTNIWIIDDLKNADHENGSLFQFQPNIDQDGDGVIDCVLEKPGDCDGSKNIMGLVSAANVIVANSPGNRSNGINLHVGTRDVGDPMGPDEYGYYIFDSEDTEYPIAPVYDWIEIGPSTGLGTDLDFDDAGNGCGSGGGWYCNFPDDYAVVPLGFDFNFYGSTSNEITVSSNGYVSFVRNEMSSFRNYHIPGAGGPSPMVAAFWDDLKVGHNNSAKVYKYVTDEYVVIQWYEVESYYGSLNAQAEDQNFQMIIYNPEYQSYPTPTGDGEIKIQYREFNNTSVGDYSQYTPIHGCYATIGIENYLGNIGLEYTFDNQYPESNMELFGENGGDPGAAILITTSPGSAGMPGDMNEDEVLNVLDVVTLVNIILNMLEPTNYQLYAGDLNSDGTSNILDVVLLVNIILEG